MSYFALRPPNQQSQRSVGHHRRETRQNTFERRDIEGPAQQDDYSRNKNQSAGSFAQASRPLRSRRNHALMSFVTRGLMP